MDGDVAVLGCSEAAAAAQKREAGPETRAERPENRRGKDDAQKPRSRLSDSERSMVIDEMCRGGDSRERGAVILLELDAASFGFLVQLRGTLAGLARAGACREAVESAYATLAAAGAAEPGSGDLFRLGADWARRLLLADEGTLSRVCDARRDYAMAVGRGDVASIKYVAGALAEFLEERSEQSGVESVSLEDC